MDICSNCGHANYSIEDLEMYPPHIPNFTSSSPSYSSAVETLTEINKNITRLDDELAALVNNREHLLAKQQALETYLHFHSPTLKPSTSADLVPELWSEIFNIVCIASSFDEPEHASRNNLLPAPMLLSHVSSSWRAIALTTPSLWTSMHLLIKPSHGDSRLNLVNLWLSRSRSRLLDVCIADDINIPFEEPVPPLDSAISAVLSQAQRWRTIELAIFPFAGSWQRFSDIRGRLTELRACSLHTIRPKYGNVHAPADRESINLFADAPLMEVLRMDRPRVFCSMDVPFGQITVLDFSTSLVSHALSLYECLCILDQCPKLIKFNSRCGFIGRYIPEFFERLHRPHLEELCLTTWPSNLSLLTGMDLFFDQLDVPGLRMLRVEAASRVEDLRKPKFLDFLGRVKDLETLEVTATEVSGRIAAEYLRLVPSIRNLNLNLSSEGAEDALERIEDRSQGCLPVELPELQYHIDKAKKTFTLRTQSDPDFLAM